MSIDPSADADAPVAPVAPPNEVWAAMSPAERAACLTRLGPIPAEAMPPVGDPHINAERDVEDALGGWFRRRGLRAYIGRGLTVYYPAQPRFAPDLFVVFNVEERDRTTWVVPAEGKGLDFVLEIHASGDRAKDLQRNREWFARQGIPEYFVFDAVQKRLFGWRLDHPERPYVPIVPQAGRWPSRVLELDLGMEAGRLRFYISGARLPFALEVQDALEKALTDAETRAAAEAERAEIEAERADAEAQRATAEAQRATAEAERAAAEAERAAAETERAETESRRVAALEAENAALRARLAALEPGRAPD